MRLPRNLSGKELVKLLSQFGYQPTRQTGSHLRVTTLTNGQHHVTIPLHDNLRVGTLANIVSDVALHFEISRQEVITKLFKQPS